MLTDQQLVLYLFYFILENVVILLCGRVCTAAYLQLWDFFRVEKQAFYFCAEMYLCTWTPRCDTDRTPTITLP